MARCSRTWTLEVHPRDPGGEYTLDNAVLLCLSCYECTPAFSDGRSRKDTRKVNKGFSRKTVVRAIARAAGRCECGKTCEGCGS